MKMIFARIVCLALLSAVAAHSAPARPPNDAEIKKLLETRLAKAGTNAAVVVGLIDGQETRIISCGKLDNGTDGKVDGDTLFELDSITKTFTTLLLADMVQRGEVKLDDPISKFLPSSVKVPTRKGREITLVDLATHTSGLPRLQDNLNPKDEADPYADYTEKELYEFLGHYKLPRDIGAEFEYSNIGMELLGQVISLKAGTNYEALVVSRVCTPLSMNSTRIILSPEQKLRFAAGHDESGKRVKNWSAPLPGDGGLRSSANDMLKYLSAHLGSPKTKLQSAMELQEIPRHAADASTQIGLSWMIVKFYGQDVVWHNGGSAGYHSFIGFDKKNQRGVVILSSSELDMDDIGMVLLAKKDATPAKHIAVKMDAALYDQYIGRYQMTPEVEMTIRREGSHLYVRLTEQDFLEIFPESETNFFLKDVEAQLSFVKDAKGVVTDAILHQDGLDQTAKKKANEAYHFDGYVPPRQNLTADGKSLEAVMTLMSSWMRAHPDFRAHSESEDDTGEKDDHVYLIHGSEWKCQGTVKEPFHASYVEFSTGTNDYLTYLPLTKKTVRNNTWSRAEVNMNRLTDWRTPLSSDTVAHYGFQAELLTNTAPYCLQITKKENPLLRYEYLVDAEGRILRTVFFNKSDIEIEWFKDWNFDAAKVAEEFDQLTVKKQVSKTDFSEAFAAEVMASMLGKK